MSEFQNTIDLLGDDVVTKLIIERTITEFCDDKIESIGIYALGHCELLESVNLPNVITTHSSVFSNDKTLKSVKMPKCTVVYDYLFDGCEMLDNVELSAVTRIRLSSFRGCKSLRHIDLQNSVYIADYVFANCTLLTVVILRGESVCSLNTQRAFDSNPFASNGTGGKLLVPRALVEEYKTATNWSVIWGYGHNQFLALEDYAVDGTITGEIDWDKLNGGTT